MPRPGTGGSTKSAGTRKGAIEATYREDGRKKNTTLTREEWIPRFCEAYSVCGSITEAATRATVDRSTVYKALDEDAAFKRLYEQARKEYGEFLIAEVNRRAVEGTEEVELTTTVDQQTGMITAREKRVRRYSDTLLIFQSKAYRRDLYGDTITVNTVDVDKEIAALAEAESVPEDVVKLEVKRMVREQLERQRAQGQLPEGRHG